MIPAVYFDGQTARKQPVGISFADGNIHVDGEGITLVEPFHPGMLSERLGNAPRQLHFSDGGYALIQDNAALEEMLRHLGIKPQSVVSRMEARWRYAAGALVITVAVGVSAYIWGLPILASEVAERIPPAIAAEMDEQTLILLDKGTLAPSTLSVAQQQNIANQFRRLIPPIGEHTPDYKLVFRNSKAIGPNAFAMPGGTILVTDQLVKLAEREPANQDQVIGVLTHELGHIHHRHALRQLVQGSVVALAMTWFLGDVSTVLAAVPTLMLQTRYTREFESQADEYALLMMKRNHLSPDLLADMLMKLESFHGLKKGTNEQDGLEGYFSTHPLTQDRIRKLRAIADEK